MKILITVVLALCAVGFGDVNIPEKDLFTENIQEVQTQLEPISVNVAFKDQTDDGISAPGDEGLLLKYLASRNLITQLIEDILEGFRDVVINGNDALPPLDPLVVDHVGPLSYSDTGIRVTGNIRNLRAEGLRWYVVDYVTFNVLRLNLGAHVTLPWLTVTGAYDVDARLALILTHRAGGNFRLFVNRVEVGVDVRMGTNIFSGHLVLRELDIKLDIHDTVIQIDGMTGSSLINSFISNFIQNLTQDIVQNNLNTLSQVLSEELFDIINDVLREYTLGDLIGGPSTAKL